MTTVLALGGNALIRAGDKGTAAEQAARLRETAQALGPSSVSIKAPISAWVWATAR